MKLFKSIKYTCHETTEFYYSQVMFLTHCGVVLELSAFESEPATFELTVLSSCCKNRVLFYDDKGEALELWEIILFSQGQQLYGEWRCYECDMPVHSYGMINLRKPFTAEVFYDWLCGDMMPLELALTAEAFHCYFNSLVNEYLKRSDYEKTTFLQAIARPKSDEAQELEALVDFCCDYKESIA